MYNVELSATCRNDDLRKTQCFDFVFQFRDEEHYELYEGDSFDNLITLWNDLLEERVGDGWYVDDIIETSDFVSDKRQPHCVVP